MTTTFKHRSLAALVLLAGLCFVAVGAPSERGVARAQERPVPAAPPLLSPEPLDFSLEETSGVMRSLAEVRGRLAIVFYEDREHTPDNEALKLTLYRFITDNGLRGRITTYGVASLLGVDGLIRDMARTAIRAIASQYGIQILLDWEGALQRAPFSFPGSGSTVAVFDREGRLRYRVTGIHTPEQTSALFRTLRQLLR